MKIVATGEYRVNEIHAQHLTPFEMKLMGKPLPEAKSIGCGAYHSLVSLTSLGTLYTCGLNNYGQLGVGHEENCESLTLVTGLSNENIVQTDGGSHHSVALSAEGKIFSFGRGDSGQLGILEGPPSGYHQNEPQEVKMPSSSKMSMVSCGSNHALAFSRDDNSVYSWGYGDMLALGNGVERDEGLPMKLDWSTTKFGNATILQVSALSHAIL